MTTLAHEVRDLKLQLRGIVAQLEILEQKLEMQEQASSEQIGSPHDRPTLKKPNGRLTTYGVGIMRKMIDEGKSDPDIARAFAITVPAVVHQRQRYYSEKYNNVAGSRRNG